MPERFLLHTCCAPCLLYPLKKLESDYLLTLFFYNPNIQPEEEYERRRKEVERVATIYQIPLLLGDYEVEFWLKSVSGLEGEKEGGKRCEVCFSLRLEKTALVAKEKNFPIFGTTLTSGRQKNAKLINQIGREIAQREGLEFFVADFKEGFHFSLVNSKRLSLYRQKYCGCLYSKR
uniref:Epoxyqueuosine reductase QueH n=1 Tax=candidate division WOR-3 bacterium TaxID=2052148 RepID=A0A7C3YSV5_UNCW3